jgi:hypothetical protein
MTKKIAGEKKQLGSDPEISVPGKVQLHDFALLIR